MLTIKYRMTDGAELMEDGFQTVTSNMGWYPTSPLEVLPGHPDYEAVLARAVTGHKPSGETITYGPVMRAAAGAPVDEQLRSWPEVTPTVWVMNEAGATVAKYEL